MKVPQHPNIALAIEALEKGNSDGAWHLLRAVPKQTEVAVFDQQDKRLKVKLGSQYGSDLNGHWFFLQPADEFADAALHKHTGAVAPVQPAQPAPVHKDENFTQETAETRMDTGFAGGAQPAPTVQELDIERWLGHPSYHDGFGRAPDLWSLAQIKAATTAMLSTPPAAQRQWELPVLVTEAQIDRALAAACLRNTPESRKDMRRALEAALNITPGVFR
jgi:hypothetical protein